ncbi:MAG: twin-arginine translocation signal domain-containing protein [Thermomicrobiales bacterium]
MNDLFRNETTRRGFLGAVVTTVVSAVVIGLLWLISREAPSAGTDPAYVPPIVVPTAVPEPTP